MKSRPFEVPQSKERLLEENADLRRLAAKYYILRDAIQVELDRGRRVPSLVKSIFFAQMKEINEEIGYREDDDSVTQARQGMAA